jgi:hypothetical protein
MTLLDVQKERENSSRCYSLREDVGGCCEVYRSEKTPDFF